MPINELSEGVEMQAAYLFSMIKDLGNKPVNDYDLEGIFGEDKPLHTQATLINNKYYGDNSCCF